MHMTSSNFCPRIVLCKGTKAHGLIPKAGFFLVKSQLPDLGYRLSSLCELTVIVKIATEAQNAEMNASEQKTADDKSSETVEESVTKKADDSDKQDNDNPQTRTAKTGQKCSLSVYNGC